MCMSGAIFKAEKAALKRDMRWPCYNDIWAWRAEGKAGLAWLA